MARRFFVGLMLTSIGLVSVLADEAKTVSNRGELLYTNHCLQCHNQQVHWRDKLKVTDRESLLVQVNHWQYTEGLEWNDNDIEEVSRYLNSRFYHFR